MPLLLIVVLVFNKLCDDRTEALVVGTRCRTSVPCDEHLETGGSLIHFQPKKEKKKNETRMTVSVLKQDSNTSKVKRNVNVT